jgi:CheY-like chemotaxis protein
VAISIGSAEILAISALHTAPEHWLDLSLCLCRNAPPPVATVQDGDGRQRSALPPEPIRNQGASMPASIVIVHDHLLFLERAASTLRAAGHDVAVFADPMLALDAIEAAERLQLLITRLTFPKGKPNGISLALMARNKRPGVKVIFAARKGQEMHTAGIGELVPHPVDLSKLAEAVARLLHENQSNPIGQS